MLKDFKKTPGNDNPFDKKRVDEGVKRDNESIKNAQKQREKNTLSLQVTNRKQELERTKLDLRNKESKLKMFRNNLDLVKREVLDLELKIRQIENTPTSLKSEFGGQTMRTTSLKSELDGVRTKENSLKRDIQKVEAELERKKTELESMNQRVRFLEVELKKIPAGGDKKTDVKKMEKNKAEDELAIKRRQIPSLEMEEKNFSNEVSRLKAEISLKEGEIMSLMSKINQIR